MNELYESARRELRDSGRDSELTWKHWVALFAVGMFVYWVVSSIRG